MNFVLYKLLEGNMHTAHFASQSRDLCMQSIAKCYVVKMNLNATINCSRRLLPIERCHNCHDHADVDKWCKQSATRLWVTDSF